MIVNALESATNNGDFFLFLFFNSHFLAAGDVKAPVAGGEEDDDEVPGQYVALNPPPPYPQLPFFF